MDKTLTTRGTGQASGTPDAMRPSVAVVVRGGSVSDALAGTASGVTALGEVARRFTSDERITSTGLHVWPQHDNAGRQVGYEARHTLSVYCLDLAKAGDMVTALGDLEGRVLIEGVEPVIADPPRCRSRHASARGPTPSARRTSWQPLPGSRSARSSPSPKVGCHTSRSRLGCSP